MLGGATRKLKNNFTLDDLLNYWEKKLNQIKSDFLEKKYPEYRVKKHDTLTKIAKLYDIDLNTLIAENEIENLKIQKGERIKLPFRDLPHLFHNLRYLKRLRESFNYIARSKAIDNVISEDELL